MITVDPIISARSAADPAGPSRARIPSGAPAALRQVLADLAAEGNALDAVITDSGADLATPTPAAGWTIAHQIGHLHWTDMLTIQTTTDPDAFRRRRPALIEALQDEIDRAAASAVGVSPTQLLGSWRRGREQVISALGAVPSGTKLSWLGPPMGAGTMASARFMETWAHGQDIVDALGVDREATDRVRHVVELGVRTRDFAFRARGLTPPTEPFRFEVRAPSGALWTWGPDDAPSKITAPAVDLALLVTRRRHADDLRIEHTGPDASRWITIAQAFVGPPGAGRAPQR